MEGIKTVRSKHAAGVVISPEKMADMCPMVYDPKSDSSLAALEMEDLENICGIKFDILGLSTLDKIMGIRSDLQTGEIHEIQ